MKHVTSVALLDTSGRIDTTRLVRSLHSLSASAVVPQMSRGDRAQRVPATAEDLRRDMRTVAALADQSITAICPASAAVVAPRVEEFLAADDLEGAAGLLEQVTTRLKEVTEPGGMDVPGRMGIPLSKFVLTP